MEQSENLDEARLTGKVKGERVAGWPHKRGQFMLLADGAKVIGLVYCCPCGCGAWRQIWLDGREGDKYSWDGDAASPTVMPDFQCRAGCQWRGFLIAGEWQDFR